VLVFLVLAVGMPGGGATLSNSSAIFGGRAFEWSHFFITITIAIFFFSSSFHGQQ
jgi:hypothetical protein